MDRFVHATAPTRADLAGGTLDIWPIPQLLRQKMLVSNDKDFPLHNSIVTLNAGLELRTSCSLSAQPRTDLSPNAIGSVSEWHLTGDVFRLGPNQLSEARRLLATHPLVGTAILHVLPALHERFCRIRVETQSDVPRGSGLGGSSSLLVSLLSAFDALVSDQPAPFSDTELMARCHLACSLEAGLLGGLAGIQDHLGAAFGGVASYELLAGGHTKRCAMPEGAKNWIEEHGVLVQSGNEHHSGSANGHLLRDLLFEGLNGSGAFFADLAQNAQIAKRSLEVGDYLNFAKAAGRDWSLRRGSYPQLSTPAIEHLVEAGHRAGAMAAKVCGAAAGGVILFFAKSTPGHQEQLAKALENEGAAILPLRIASLGVQARLGDGLPGAALQKKS